MNTPLTKEIVESVSGALARIEELKSKVIKESTDAAEQRGLEKYVSDTITPYLPELIANWITVRDQYSPLVRGFVALIANANGVLNARAKE